MYKNSLITTIIGLSMVVAPMLASAQTAPTMPLNNLQAEIQSLLARVQALQAQISKVSSSSSISVSNAETAMPFCYSFGRSLSLGSRGNDVSALQQFLISKGFAINAGATGYFGLQTKMALSNWQAKNDIAAEASAGAGIFGPLSRGAFGRWCNTAGTSTSTASTFSLSADPQSGKAPLSVTFTTSAPIATGSSTFSVDFGDKTAEAAMSKGSCIGIAAIVGGQGGIRCSYSATHTYATNGIYTARLMRDTCPKGALCFVGPQSVATTMVTVGSSTQAAVSFTANPQTGASPLQVQFKVTAPQGTSRIGNTVAFGDGITSRLGFIPTCASCNVQATVSHIYTKPGTYHAQLENNTCNCPINGVCNCPMIPILASSTITVTGNTSTSSNGITQINAPGIVMLSQGGIAEIRNKSAYFTLTSLSSTAATIQITGVGCWNSFPSDTPPEIRCMIAVMPLAPQTLTIGQTYSSGGSYSITLTGIANNKATFSISASTTL